MVDSSVEQSLKKHGEERSAVYSELKPNITIKAVSSEYQVYSRLSRDSIVL